MTTEALREVIERRRAEARSLLERCMSDVDSHTARRSLERVLFDLNGWMRLAKEKGAEEREPPPMHTPFQAASFTAMDLSLLMSMYAVWKTLENVEGGDSERAQKVLSFVVEAHAKVTAAIFGDGGFPSEDVARDAAFEMLDDANEFYVKLASLALSGMPEEDFRQAYASIRNALR